MTIIDHGVEHLDVVIIGAGISGLGAARYLKTEHPGRSVAILESRDDIGGTWSLFKYPGIRSDSDLHTFGYEFAPWTDRESIASAPRILSYLRTTAEDHGVIPLVRFHRKVVAASWSSETARWTLEIEHTDTGERSQATAGWIFGATGYYRYDEGYTPAFEGREDFAGAIMHPQHWDEDLDYDGKRVVVIGSGATAMTIVPAMADRVEQVTMLQRTPTYVMPVPRTDPLALLFRKVLGEERGYAATRRKNIMLGAAIWKFCQRYPKRARAMIRKMNVKALPPGYPVDVHFNPPYDPWDQRLCVVPDGDFFASIRDGKASVVTDRIVRFTPVGILLESGRELKADIIVTATGLTMQLLGGMTLTVDGEPVELSETMIYRGTMLTGVPNLALAIGYTNSTWTLKIGLLCEYFCKLLSHMDTRGADIAQVDRIADIEARPLLDFGAGYVQRSLASLPKQGPTAPWRMSTSFQHDVKLLRNRDVVDEHLRLSRAGADIKMSALVGGIS